MRARTASIVTAEALTQYKRHGYAILPDIVSDAVLRCGEDLVGRWTDHVVRRWYEQGLLSHDYSEHDIWHRYLFAYRDAGWPHHRRNPNHHLINAAMYAILRSPEFIDVAASLLGTREIAVHGIFNARPQVPDRSWDGLLTTKWHQDGQFRFQDYGEGNRDLDASTPVVTFWFPLHDVDEESGCLQVFSLEETKNELFEVYGHDYERTGTVGLAPEVSARFTPIPAPMRRGDLLVLGQRTPHAAMPMTAERVRWSIDVRYEALATWTAHGKKFGFVANSDDDPGSVTPVEEWVRRQLPADS